jgi:hypothetical protein
MTKRDAYFSVDVEADGPIPGPYSMLSFGLALCGRSDGDTLSPVNPERHSFYRELKPISTQSVPAATSVSRLDREQLMLSGMSPRQAMVEAREWIETTAGEDYAVLVGFPLVFDWMFMYWYLERYAKGSPFHFSAGLDMKTMYQQKARVPVSLAGLDHLPKHLRSQRPHTHNARDDAIEQAEIFVRLFEWDGA